MDDISSLPGEMKEEYLISMPSKKDELNERHSNIPESKPKKPVVQDTYDEDNYCLARTSGFGPHDTMRIVDQDKKENDGNTSLDKSFTISCTTCKILSTSVGILMLGAIGCVLFFFLPTDPCKI